MAEKIYRLAATYFMWAGLRLVRDTSTQCYRALSGEFEWEVDMEIDEDDVYEARVSLRGVKLAIGVGRSRIAALTAVRAELVRNSALINVEILERHRGQRPEREGQDQTA